ncbi:MAG TPA: PHP domain-containing protein [Bacillota bacterium]|nr:PHP domain-containing protein [Bacillota bacterium]HPL53857.1 PHP domain-containing protein [Bacillota bacterium]
MKFAVDFHIHTALSPCGDEDMTPCNIVNMAILKGLDIIAVTDHNSCSNLPAVMEAAKENGLMVIPGMEVQTKEEVHILCLFKRMEGAMKFAEIVYNSLPNIKNNEEIFGRQLIFNSLDEIVAKEDKLLLSSTVLSVNDVFILVRGLGGICIPAHVDRQGFSIITNLGFIPPDLKVKTIEISKKSTPETVLRKYPFLNKFKYIVSSDAHYLQDISEREFFIELDFLSVSELFDELNMSL